MSGYTLEVSEEAHEIDTSNWLERFDQEQEQCFCLGCGDELPCGCAWGSA